MRREGRVACLMLAALVVVGLAIPAASATGLYFTKDVVEAAPLAGVPTYRWSGVLPASGEVPTPANLLYYSQQQVFRFPAPGNLTFIDDGRFAITMRCKTAGPVSGFGVALELERNGTSTQLQYVNVPGPPLGCTSGALADLRVPINVSFLRIAAGENFQLRFYGVAGEPGGTPDGSPTTSAIVVGDPLHLSGVEANTTQQPAFFQRSDHYHSANQSWDSTRYWTTDASAGAVNLTGQIAQGSLDFTVSDLATGDQLLSYHVDSASSSSPRTVDLHRLLPAGVGTRWRIVTHSSYTSKLSLELTPVAITTASVVTKPVANGTNLPTHSPAPTNTTAPPATSSDKTPLGPVVLLAPLAAAVLATRRRNR